MPFCLIRSAYGETDDKCASLAGGALQRNRAAVELADVLHNRQTKAGAAVLPCPPGVHPIKTFKDSALILWRDADAGVRDAD